MPREPTARTSRRRLSRLSGRIEALSGHHLETDRRLFFVHVMKTAGGTFRWHAYRQFGPGEVFPDPALDGDIDEANWRIDYLLRLPPERRERTRMFMGHFPFVVIDLLGLDLAPLTMLRDPVERTISQLKQRQRLHEPHRSLEEIYEDPFFFPMMLHNAQAKVFAMTRDDRLESFMDIVDVDDRRLEVAKANLERVEVIGFQDRFDEFLADVSRRFEWQVHDLPDQHVSEPVAIASSFRRRIARDNAADQDFYDFARSLAERRGAARVSP